MAHTIKCEACFEKAQNQTPRHIRRRIGDFDRAHNRHAQERDERIKIDCGGEYALHYDGRRQRRRILYAFG